MPTIFHDHGDFHLMDRAAFDFQHALASHPNLSLARLAETIPQIDPRLVFHSGRKMSKGEDFEQAITANRQVESIADAIANIETSNAYIMVREPESHIAFFDIHRQLVSEIERHVAARGWGQIIINPRSYLFISSPGSVTPFHYDRASNFLLQIRGTKEVTVFPPWDDRVITPQAYESHMAYEEATVRWKASIDPRGKTFVCGPGNAIHIPFAAGHYVQNGKSELSITLSIFFNHRRSQVQLNALYWNHKLRHRMGTLGLKPVPVGRLDLLDQTKSLMFRMHQRIAR